MTRLANVTAHDEKLRKLLDRIVPALAPEAVYLFGSRARGDAVPESDYDLLVVVPDDTPREKNHIDRHISFDAGNGRSR